MDSEQIGWKNVDLILLARDGGPMAGFCEHGNEFAGFLKCCMFFE
jgi:hypothetical protein